MRIKSKLKKWVIGISLFLIILLAVVYFGINYAADKMMDKLSDSILESAMGTAIPSAVDEGQPSSSASAPPTSAATDAKLGSTSQSDSGSSDQAESGDSNSSSAPAKPSDNSTKDSDHSYSAEVSVDKAATVKDEITFSEKTKLMTIMLKRLNADDIKTLSDLAGGGLSVEKKKEAKKIILEKLSEKEYDELIKIAQKYGLSQGKSYEDSKKEKGMQE